MSRSCFCGRARPGGARSRGRRPWDRVSPGSADVRRSGPGGSLRPSETRSVLDGHAGLALGPELAPGPGPWDATLPRRDRPRPRDLRKCATVPRRDPGPSGRGKRPARPPGQGAEPCQVATGPEAGGPGQGRPVHPSGPGPVVGRAWNGCSGQDSEGQCARPGGPRGRAGIAGRARRRPGQAPGRAPDAGGPGLACENRAGPLGAGRRAFRRGRCRPRTAAAGSGLQVIRPGAGPRPRPACGLHFGPVGRDLGRAVRLFAGYARSLGGTPGCAWLRRPDRRAGTRAGPKTSRGRRKD